SGFRTSLIIQQIGEIVPSFRPRRRPVRPCHRERGSRGSRYSGRRSHCARARFEEKGGRRSFFWPSHDIPVQETGIPLFSNKRLPHTPKQNRFPGKILLPPR